MRLIKTIQGYTASRCSRFTAIPLLLALIVAGSIQAQETPKGYKLLFQEDFDAPSSLERFTQSDPSAWKHSNDALGSTMELFKQSDYNPPHRSPFNMSLITDQLFTDFILEVKLLQTGKVYGHQDMCLFFGHQDPAHFYYVHIAAKTDDHAHNVFIVNDAPRIKISQKTTEGVRWGQNVWHTVRLERSVSTGTIKVYYDDLNEPIMVADDKSFGAGRIGFGSFDDVGKVDSIRIWGTATEESEDKPF